MTQRRETISHQTRQTSSVHIRPNSSPKQPLQVQHLLVDGLLVGSLIQQSIQLGGVRDLDLSNPALTLGALVDGLCLVLQNRVTADNLASNWGQHVGSRLDGLDGTDGLASTNLEVGLGELDEDNVTQRVGSVVGDTDLGCRTRLVIRLFTCNRHYRLPVSLYGP